MCVGFGPNAGAPLTGSEKSYHVREISQHVAALLQVERTPALDAKVMVALHGLCKDWRAGEASGAERWEGC